MTLYPQVAAVRAALAVCLIGLLAAGNAGCVSSTLDSNDFRPVGGQSVGGAPSQPPNTTQQSNIAQPQSLTAETAQQPPSQPASSDSGATGSVSDPVKRQQALDEIRAKAAASSGEKTQIGAVPGSATQQMSAQEQAEIASRLEDNRQATGAELSDDEIEARKAAIRRLQQKGKTHYERALDSIEN